ncbi:MAG: pilus assembly protein PilP [Porticoccaceae bacterium]|nr:pilus assembly protein PilP [Porticoccaceae bacterium]
MNKVASNKILLIVGLSLMILGCSGANEHGDLQAFMDAARSRPQGEIEPLPTFSMYESFKYSVMAFRSPFEKPLTVTVGGDQKGKLAVKPDENREKEYLEGFNLMSLTLVGTFKKDGTIWSLINDGEGSVHRVTVGNYVGKNHGKITAVTASQTDVIEIVPDGKTGWVERPRALALKENN